MNNKEKQIEEMARVLCDKCLEDGNPCDGAKRICVTTRNTATTLYNAGYRKVNDEELKKFYSLEEADYWKSRVEEIGDVARKETAREILQELRNKKFRTMEWDIVVPWDDIEEVIEEEYGVEVE